MSWISRRVDEHRCNKPYLKSEAPDVSIGDRWLCDDESCGIIWVVVGFDSGMQHDPYPTVIKWDMGTGRVKTY